MNDPSGLTDEDYELIGQVAVSFGHLEREVARARMALAAGNGATKKQISTMATQTLGGQIKGLIEAIDDRFGESEELKKLRAALDDANNHRIDSFHGTWRRDSKGLACVSFRPKRNEDVVCMREHRPETAELNAIIQSNWENAKMLCDLAEEHFDRQRGENRD